eukprot:Skav227510  [mRNA]  locus=scaffold282:282394:283278:+ [translate_table: standard]
MTSIQPSFQANEWPKVFATSPALSTSAYLIFRGVLALIFVVHLVLHVYVYAYLQGIGWYWIMYQSRIALVLQTLSLVAQFVAGLIAIPELPKTRDSMEPLWVRATVFLDYFVQPQAFGITYFYWGFRAFAGEEMMDGVEFKAVIDYLDYFLHGINWVLLLMSFLLSRIPFTFDGFILSMVLGGVYVLWTYIHYLLGLGVAAGSCPQYPGEPERCPLYTAFDWNDPQRAGLAVFVSYVVAGPINTAVYVALASARSRCFPEKVKLEEKAQLLEEVKPAQPEPPQNCCCGLSRPSR